KGHFCYYHSKTHSIGSEPDLKFGPLQLPPPEDAAAIQLSVARINNAVINNLLDLKKAAILLNGLKLAARFIDRYQRFDAEDTVRSAEQVASGDELAPASCICSEDDDCGTCRHARLCPRAFNQRDIQGAVESNNGEPVPVSVSAPCGPLVPGPGREASLA